MSCETRKRRAIQLFILKALTMLYVRFGVLILFAGRPFTADTLLVSRERSVATQLGGEVTFDINGAVESQCKTYEGLMVVCFDGSTMAGIWPGFQNRISGSCDHIKLKDVQKGDLDHMFICENLDPLKPASYTYYIKATTAPPQNVSLSVNGSKVSVSWQPPPADWQTGPILEYEVKMSCNGTELLMNEVTVAETSTVLEGLPQEVWCTVSVAAVTSEGVEAWSKRKSFFIRLSGPSGNTGTDLQPFDKTKLFWLLVVPPMVLLVLFLVKLLLRKRHMNGVSSVLQRPKPKAEQTENSYSLVHITQLHPLHETQTQTTQTQTTDHMLS